MSIKRNKRFVADFQYMVCIHFIWNCIKLYGDQFSISLYYPIIPKDTSFRFTTIFTKFLLFFAKKSARIKILSVRLYDIKNGSLLSQTPVLFYCIFRLYLHIKIFRLNSWIYTIFLTYFSLTFIFGWAIIFLKVGRYICCIYKTIGGLYEPD